MATFVGKITLACPGGRVVRKLTGSSADVIARSTRFDPRSVGAGCSVQKVEIVRRGVGVGARDPYTSENPFGAARRRRRRARRRR